MRYSTHVSILVFCALFVWIQNLQAQNSACDCLDESPTIFNPPQDITICEGDTIPLSFDAFGRTDFPTAYFFEKSGNIATRLLRYDYESGNIDTIPLSMGQMADVRGGTYIGQDTLAVIMASGRLFYVYVQPNSVSVEQIGNFPERPDYEWQGLEFINSIPALFAIASNLDTTVVYELDTATIDTILIQEHIGRFRGLASVDPFLLATVDINSDSLIGISPGSANQIQDVNLNLQNGQGVGVDRFGGLPLVYTSFYDGVNGYLGLFPDSSGNVCIFDTIGTQQLRPLILAPSDTFQRDSLIVSWSPNTRLSPSDSFSTRAFPDTTTTYYYSVTDICGNTTTDSVTVTVIQRPDSLNSMTCIGNVNITLDGINCIDTVTADELLSGSFPCKNEFYEVILPNRSEPILGPADVGDTLSATVQPRGGGNACWSNIIVKDDSPPTIVCENDTIDFGETAPQPTADDNCNAILRIDTLWYEPIAIDPCDTNLLYGDSTVIVAIDSSGNRSDTCERVVYVRRPVVEDIIFPDSFAIVNGTQISCDDDFDSIPGTPYPDTNYTGQPETLGGTPINDLDDDYNIAAYFVDMPQSSTTTCKTSFVRMWTVLTWVCSSSGVMQTDTVGVYPQLIEIQDTTPPVIICPTFDDPISTNGSTCTASVFIPYPDVSDNCSGIQRVTVNYPGGTPIFDLQPPGATIELPVGSNTVTYMVTDNCFPTTDNSDTCSVVIEVEDLNGPTVIGRVPTVGLNPTTETTRVYASSFDDGSYDDCGLDRLEVARMFTSCGFAAQEFGPFVEFNCCDAGETVMIILRAYDVNGNFNDIMTEINIQDKTAVQIIPPDDVTVTCQYPIDTSDLSAFGKVVVTDNPNAILNRNQEPDVDPIIVNDPGRTPQEQMFGFDGVAYDNCDLSISTYFEVDEMSCNRMLITRTFVASSFGTPQDSVTQTISVENVGGFSESNVLFPLDTMIVGTCGGQSLHPDSLGGAYGWPQVTPSPCSDIMYNYEDDFFYSLTPGDSVCYKILRTWRVTDWCSRDQRTGQPVIVTGTQLIKVVNTQGPVFDPSPDSLSECSTSPNCGPGFIALQQTAEDDCTADQNLRWRYQIDLENDGSIDEYGNTNNASDTYPIGTHRIIWTVEDECGNETDRIQYFSILSCKGPNVVLIPGVILELTPMDTDGDGVNDAAMNQVTAQQIGYKSNHDCGLELSYSFSPTDPDDTIRTYNCDSMVGIKYVNVYVTASNGIQDFARTWVAVQDNMQFCSNDPGPIHPISGNITSPNGNTLSNTRVIMDGDANLEVVTDINGAYSFPAMPEGGSYEITPQKTDDVLNGVSTFDVLLIQQFILGLNNFSDPMLQIAADIDNNEKITGKDIIELRKVILGLENDFTSNTSWRFVDANYTFNGSDPLSEAFPESYVIPRLDADMKIDFHAIKVGDVNHSVNYQLDGAITRSHRKDYFIVPMMKLENEEATLIPIYANTAYNTVFGAQFQWSANSRAMEVMGIESGQLEITADNIVLDENGLKLSYTHAQGVSIDHDVPLFYIVVKAQRSHTSNNQMYLNNAQLNSELYTELGISELELRFRDSDLEEEAFELSQNQPNPFSEQTIIRFRLPEAISGTLNVTDASGKQLLLIERDFNSGWNQVQLNRNELGQAGMYYYQVTAGPFQGSKKMILID